PSTGPCIDIANLADVGEPIEIAMTNVKTSLAAQKLDDARAAATSAAAGIRAVASVVGSASPAAKAQFLAAADEIEKVKDQFPAGTDLVDQAKTTWRRHSRPRAKRRADDSRPPRRPERLLARGPVWQGARRPSVKERWLRRGNTPPGAGENLAPAEGRGRILQRGSISLSLAGSTTAQAQLPGRAVRQAVVPPRVGGRLNLGRLLADRIELVEVIQAARRARRIRVVERAGHVGVVDLIGRPLDLPRKHRGCAEGHHQQGRGERAGPPTKHRHR